MRNLFLLFSIFLFLKCIANENYIYSINLTKVDNDKVTVLLSPPTFTQSEVEFCFPAMVPGTYEVYNFGRFISNFTATGKNGTKITITKLDLNTYKLSPANQLDKISYSVDDTWDKTDLPNTKQKIIFEPGGTNIEDGKNFSINTHSMFGYFKNFTNKKFILEFQKPKGFYPVTGISDMKISDSNDVVSVFDYHELVDSPIMYSLPDTATIVVGNATVLVGCYSPNKKINANYIANTLKELLYAQRDYLGGTLPVNKYAFIFYFIDKPTQSGASGALEHSYSSFYVLPELDSTILQQTLCDVSAHEFFHIVTPLNIHATQIGNFDFNNPKMSEHLWLYEGMTEYAAHHAQLKGKIISVGELLKTMIQKYETSIENFNDTMSFTWMSKNVLNEKIHPQYYNVYEKGAVIGMCLDILLRDLSNGKYGTQNLMKDLATKYGKNKSFNDEDLFNDIEKFTYPEVGVFLRNYVGGHQPLPIKETFLRIGLNFEKEVTKYDFTIGVAKLNFNENTNRYIVGNDNELDDFGKTLGFKLGDELNTINGKQIKAETLRDIMKDYFKTIKEGDVVEIEVYRPKRKLGKYKVKTLKAKASKVKIIEKNQITSLNETTDKQKQTLKVWLGL
jgi:predicted metalloprotease with PDZ domain